MDSLFLDIKYAKIIGVQHDRFKVKKDNPFHGQCRCRICGDSAKSKSLARFHFTVHAGLVFVRCFNCGYSNSIQNYMKMYFTGEFSEYCFEKYRKDIVEHVIISPKVADAELIPKEHVKCFKLDLPYVSDLPEDHFVKKYVASRKLPDYPFQFAQDFYSFSAQYNDDLKEDTRVEPRLVIPFFDRQGQVFAYQGRDMTGLSRQKYITITVDKSIPKIFGIDRANFKEPLIIVEGPLDSLFLKNCVASVNASLVATARKLERVINKSLITLVLDNEPRNSVIVDIYQKAIKDGYQLVIWPKETEHCKDINDLVLAGYNPARIIAQNTFSGLRAQIEFSRWKKV
jgi:hypothetical protein